MTADENVKGYVDSLYKDGPEFMEELRSYAKEHEVPIIRRQTEGFLKSLLLLSRPEKILEIGTGIAYSSIFMANTLPESHIVTIEDYPPRIETSDENIKKAGLEDRISLLEGDAGRILPELKESFDFIFLDGPKAQYISFLPDLIRLLKKGGVLLSDNVLQGGETACSRFALERRQRTIHARMREFLYAVTHSEELYTSILTVEDGLSLSIKI